MAPNALCSALLVALAALPDLLHAQPVLAALDRFYTAVAERAAPYAFSVAVVRGDQTIHVAGYGERSPLLADRVTAETPFYIASSTKSFTALTAALLAARGVVDLDAPITRYAPEFSLPAPLDPSRVTLRRLLSHRAGFESGPLAFRTAYVGDVPADSLLALVARTARPVDTTFTYTNTAFIVAARVLERATGTPWQELVKQFVLDPLGMTRTTARVSEAEPWRVAAGIGPGPKHPLPLPGKPQETMHAAGGMVMSARDAAVWLRAQVQAGRLGKRKVFPATVIAETHRQWATQSNTMDGVQRFGYALGWQIGVVDGDTLFHHFGNYPGAFAHVSFMPSSGIGVAVLTNSEMPAFARTSLILARRAYDAVLAQHTRDDLYASYPDSLASDLRRMQGIFASDHERRAARPRAPARGWKAFEGDYESPDMGRIAVRALDDTTGRLLYGAASQRLEVLAGDTLRASIPPGRGGAPIPATPGPDGRITSLQIAGAKFTRVRP